MVNQITSTHDNATLTADEGNPRASTYNGIVYSEKYISFHMDINETNTLTSHQISL